MAVDEVATRRARSARSPSRSVDRFDFGANRTAYERVWTLERYDALTAILAAVPIIWRHFVKRRIFAVVGDRPGGADSVRAAYLEVAAAHADLPPPAWPLSMKSG
jgi:N-methylhydantoinase B